MSELTMVLCNYARREQLEEIVETLFKQSVRPRIFIWNNDVTTPYVDDRVDWVINSSKNSHLRHVVSLWQQASTPFVGRMDDDLNLADDDVLADALQALKRRKHPDQIIGAYGVRMYNGETYERSHHISIPKGHGQEVGNTGMPHINPKDQFVDAVKGRIMLLRQEATHKLTCGIRHVHTDLSISCQLAGVRRFHHYLAGCFFGRNDLNNINLCHPRLIDFPLDDKGYCDHTDHLADRDKVMQEWLKRARPHKSAKSRPPDRSPEECARV